MKGQDVQCQTSKTDSPAINLKNNDQTWKLNLCLLGLTLGFDEAEIKGIVTHIYD